MQKYPPLSEHLLTPEVLSRALCALLASASLILVINQYTDIDLMLADLYFDAQHHDFPWRDSWFATRLMHGWVKYAIIGFGMLLLGLTLVDALRPLRRLPPLRRLQLHCVVATMVLAPITVALLKQGSNVHCPWSLARYGGSETLLRLLDWVPSHWDAGRCFPAGQTSTGT